MFIATYVVSNSNPPPPPTPNTKMSCQASVLQGSIYKLFLSFPTVYLHMLYSGQPPRLLKDLFVFPAMYWFNYHNHCI